MNEIEQLAKKLGGRLKHELKSTGQYKNATYEFKSRTSAREFVRLCSRDQLSLYTPFFCDEFKYAQVTVYVAI